MRAALVIAMLAGCGFTADGGQGSPGGDGHDAGPPAEGSVQPGDGPTDSLHDGAVDAGPSDCPVGYAPIGNSGSQYRYATAPLSWVVAEADCDSDLLSHAGPTHTHLVVLDDAAERSGLIQNHSNLWIGANDSETEGAIVWVTAQPAPYDLSGATANADNKDCVRMKNMGTDEFRDCAEPNPFVCECDRYDVVSRSR